MAKKNNLKQQVSQAIGACVEKKAEDVAILQMEKDSGAFTDYANFCCPAYLSQMSDSLSRISA